MLVLPRGSSSRAPLCFWVRELFGVTPCCSGFQESSRRCQELSDKANPPRSASPLNSHTWKPFERPGLETESNTLEMTDCICVMWAVFYRLSMFTYCKKTSHTKSLLSRCYRHFIGFVIQVQCSTIIRCLKWDVLVQKWKLLFPLSFHLYYTKNSLRYSSAFLHTVKNDLSKL